MTEMFTAVDPGEGNRTDLTGRELLDRASQKIEQDLGLDPVVRVGRPLYEDQKRALGAAHPGTLYLQRQLGWVAAYQNRNAEAEQLYREVWAGDREQAFQRMQKSLDSGLGAITQIESIPDLAPLRSDPRFAALVAEVKQKMENRGQLP